MGSTWNDNYRPSNEDQWNLITDWGKSLILNNRVIPVFSKAERDGLADGAPDGIIPDGTLVVRMDQSSQEPVFDLFVGGKWKDGKPADVSFSPDTPFTGVIVMRRLGGWVSVQGELVGTANEGNNTVGKLPAGVPTPATGSARGAVYFTGGYSGVAWVTNNGNIGVSQQSGASRPSPSFTVNYRVG